MFCLFVFDNYCLYHHMPCFHPFSFVNVALSVFLSRRGLLALLPMDLRVFEGREKKVVPYKKYGPRL